MVEAESTINSSSSHAVIAVVQVVSVKSELEDCEERVGFSVPAILAPLLFMSNTILHDTSLVTFHPVIVPSYHIYRNHLDPVVTTAPAQSTVSQNSSFPICERNAIVPLASWRVATRSAVRELVSTSIFEPKFGCWKNILPVPQLTKVNISIVRPVHVQSVFVVVTHEETEYPLHKLSCLINCTSPHTSTWWIIKLARTEPVSTVNVSSIA
jgi:hypothetical protein